MSGQGFQFTPFGMVPLGAPVPQGDEVNGGAVPTLSLPPQAEPVSLRYDIRTVPQTDPVKAALANVQPRDVVKMARARAKDIRAELRRLKSLQRELAELERLIAAAKNRSPRATVRALDTARRTG